MKNLLLFSLLAPIIVACTFVGDTRPQFPEEWSYMQIRGTVLEVPMPFGALTEEYHDNFTIYTSEPLASIAQPPQDTFFFFAIREVQLVDSLEEYISGLCFKDGQQNVTLERMDGVPIDITHQVEDSFAYGQVKIYAARTNCNYYGFVLTHILIYQNEVYEIGGLDLGAGDNPVFAGKAILNIRPIQMPE